MQFWSPDQTPSIIHFSVFISHQTIAAFHRKDPLFSGYPIKLIFTFHVKKLNFLNFHHFLLRNQIHQRFWFPGLVIQIQEISHFNIRGKVQLLSIKWGFSARQGTHKSFHTSIPQPFPIRKHDPLRTNSFVLRIPFHTRESPILAVQLKKDFPLRYFIANTVTQSRVSLLAINHPSLVNIALLISWNFRKPKPPSNFGVQIESQDFKVKTQFALLAL